MSHLPQLINKLQFPQGSEDSAQTQRLFHGRGHAYEHLQHVAIDWLPPVVLITLFAPEPLNEVEKFAKVLLVKLAELNLSCSSIQLQHRYEKYGPIDVIHGENISQLEALESNLKYKVTLGKARNTGLFLDMKNGRNWVQKHSKGKRVLNLFSYTCGFSVAAIAGGAKSVLNVDLSSPALNRGRDNHHLNNQSLKQIKFEKLNIFKSFGRLKKRGPFDLLICDPPTFQKGSVNIERDYPKIMRRLDEFMAPNATLLLCLNAPDLSRDFLIDNMRKLAPKYQLTKEIKPPEVYKEAQNKGLKVLIFKHA